MTKDQAHWWRHAAQSLSRAGLLWLALTAVALGSLASTGTALAPNARLVAASSIGSTGKLKINGSGSATVVPGELTHRAVGPDTSAKRIHAGGTPVGLMAVGFAVVETADADRLPVTTAANEPLFKPSAFSARAPPA